MKNKKIFYELAVQLNKNVNSYNAAIAPPKEIQDQLPYIQVGLNDLQIHVLTFLRKTGNRNVSEIARQTGFTQPYISYISKKLCSLNFMQKLTSPTNKSAVCLDITEKGKQLLDRNSAFMFTYIKNCLIKILSIKEQVEYLEKLRYVNSLIARVYKIDYDESNVRHEVNDDKFFQEIYKEMKDYSWINNASRNMIQKTRRKDLAKKYNYPEINCLLTIFYNEELSISALAKTLNRPFKAVSKTISRLIKDEQVERFQKSGDRRLFFVRLTKNCREILLEDHEIYVSHLNNLFKETPLDRITKLLNDLSYLKTVWDHFKEIQGQNFDSPKKQPV